jgi:coiled-coil domain-containing protein 55
VHASASSSSIFGSAPAPPADEKLFDYDAFLEQKAAMDKPREAAGPSRYIESLLAKAQERNKGRDAAFERKMAREIAADAEAYHDKETFVTAAYSAKLEERRAEELAAARQQAHEDSAAQKKDVSSFFRNHLLFADTARVPAAPQQALPAHPKGEALVTLAAGRQGFSSGEPRHRSPAPAEEEPAAAPSSAPADPSTQPLLPSSSSSEAEIAEETRLALERFAKRKAAGLL